MKMQQMTFLLPPYGTATLQFPEVLTSEKFARLESAVASAIREPLLHGGASVATDDPGTIEFDSWLTHLCQY
ncbi:MAG: hypothetical protein IAE92_12435 [Burkholderiaceae bacterium]|nr:hypothetical protein [Burkholderiaceae bacterium]